MKFQSNSDTEIEYETEKGFSKRKFRSDSGSDSDESSVSKLPRMNTEKDENMFADVDEDSNMSSSSRENINAVNAINHNKQFLKIDNSQTKEKSRKLVKKKNLMHGKATDNTLITKEDKLKNILKELVSII